MVLVHSLEELRVLLGSPGDRAVDKQRSRLHAIDRAWLAASPFCLVASSDIEQIFFHCAKAFLRSALWEVDSWQPQTLPSHAEIVKAVQKTQMTREELEAHYGPSYQRKLYE